jgi:hypothetical protein
MTPFAGALLVAATLAPTAPPTPLFDLPDPRITEASGIARGIASPDVYYVQNDSGDTARFFAIDADTGALRAVIRVRGAANHDWEDLAVAPDARGTPSVWLADIGDNTAKRSQVEIYRVDEPRIAPRARGVTLTVNAADVWRLRYPSGPANAESLAVTPTGRAYVFTKNPTGDAVAYAVPAKPNTARVQPLQRIGTMPIPPLATGAAISTDGSLLAVRTYFGAYLWRLRDADVAAAVGTKPTEVMLPVQRQGEGICFSDGRLVVDSEGSGTPVWSVPLPASLTASTTPSPTHAAQTSSSPSAPSPSTTRQAPSSNSTRTPLLATLVLIAVGCVWLAVRRLQRRG